MRREMPMPEVMEWLPAGRWDAGDEMVYTDDTFRIGAAESAMHVELRLYAGGFSFSFLLLL